MKKLLSIMTGVVIKPRATFTKISSYKEAKETFIEGPTIYIISCLCYTVIEITYFGVERSSDLIGKIIGLFVLAGLDSLSARLLKAKGNYATLLANYFVISSVWIISLPVLLFFSFFKFNFVKILPFIIVIWEFVLGVMAIKETYRFSLLKSVLTRILSILFLITFLALLLAVVK